MQLTDVRIRASTYEKTPTQLGARIADFDRRDRLARARKAFTPVFLGACVMLFVPPHVPWFLFLTFVALIRGALAFRPRFEIQVLEGPCPGCALELQYEPPADFPAIKRCPSCGAFLKLERAA